MGLGWGRGGDAALLLLLKDRRAPGGAAGKPAAEVPGYSVREGVRSASFIKIMPRSFSATLLTIALMIHLVPLLDSRGLNHHPYLRKTRFRARSGRLMRRWRCLSPLAPC